MVKEFDAADHAEARAFFNTQKKSALLRLTLRGNFVFVPASDAIGHHSTVVMAPRVPA